MKWPSFCQKLQDIKTKTLGMITPENEKEDSTMKVSNGKEFFEYQ